MGFDIAPFSSKLRQSHSCPPLPVFFRHPAVRVGLRRHAGMTQTNPAREITFQIRATTWKGDLCSKPVAHSSNTSGSATPISPASPRHKRLRRNLAAPTVPCPAFMNQAGR